eukprot:CAMPEP_0204308260 /NCGR_PEP_ID=MMETSP0469-20131031/400_1 /ASSEMBLY_ACC=CAM_ASM_000384 /TAXON_ID=2969 /ORGANISM="Oxyrrhis marina" /LENGTH=541 /DNA_ID=CAMNT_0051287715 /DNA_START=20 /DNA_END=1645 /DNA_ORIENTATION=+
MRLSLCVLGSVASSTAPYPRSQSPVSSIFAISSASRSAAELLCLDTLAGNLARESPKLYRVAGSNWATDKEDSYSVWLRSVQHDHPEVIVDSSLLDAPLASILTHFRSSVSSCVRSAGQDASTSAAMTLAAAGEGYLVVDDDATEAAATTAGLKCKDLRGQTVSAVLTDEVVGNLSTRVIVFQDPKKSQFLADYAVFARAPVLRYGDDTTAQNKLLDRSTDVGVCLGWGPENAYVTTCNQHGKYVHASDFNTNLALLSNTDPARAVPWSAGDAPAAGSEPAETADRRGDGKQGGDSVHTVTFLMTDGDNLQWTLGPWATNPQWFGGERGQVPMGWTFCPAAAMLAPSATHSIMSNLTGQDELVAGPSGAGYAYPKEFPKALLGDLNDLTTEGMEMSNMSLLNVIAQSDDEPDLDLLSQFITPAEGMIFYGFGNGYCNHKGKLWWIGEKPVVSGRYGLWGDGTSGRMLGVDALIATLAEQAKTPDSADGYSVVPVHAWSHSYADVVAVVEGLKKHEGVEVVKPSELIARIKANVKPGSSVLV